MDKTMDTKEAMVLDSCTRWWHSPFTSSLYNFMLWHMPFLFIRCFDYKYSIVISYVSDSTCAMILNDQILHFFLYKIVLCELSRLKFHQPTSRRLLVCHFKEFKLCNKTNIWRTINVIWLKITFIRWHNGTYYHFHFCFWNTFKRFKLFCVLRGRKIWHNTSFTFFKVIYLWITGFTFFIHGWNGNINYETTSLFVIPITVEPLYRPEAHFATKDSLIWTTLYTVTLAIFV